MTKGGTREGAGRKKVGTVEMRQYIGVRWLHEVTKLRREITSARAQKIVARSDAALSARTGLSVMDALDSLDERARRRHLRKLARELGNKRLPKSFPGEVAPYSCPCGACRLWTRTADQGDGG